MMRFGLEVVEFALKLAVVACDCCRGGTVTALLEDTRDWYSAKRLDRARLLPCCMQMKAQ